MAELFGVQKPAISTHLKKIFEEGELDEKVVVSKMETTICVEVIQLNPGVLFFSEEV